MQSYFVLVWLLSFKESFCLAHQQPLEHTIEKLWASHIYRARVPLPSQTHTEMVEALTKLSSDVATRAIRVKDHEAEAHNDRLFFYQQSKDYPWVDARNKCTNRLSGYDSESKQRETSPPAAGKNETALHHLQRVIQGCELQAHLEHSPAWKRTTGYQELFRWQTGSIWRHIRNFLASPAMSIYGNNCLITSILLPLEAHPELPRIPRRGRA